MLISLKVNDPPINQPDFAGFFGVFFTTLLFRKKEDSHPGFSGGHVVFLICGAFVVLGVRCIGRGVTRRVVVERRVVGCRVVGGRRVVGFFVVLLVR